MRLANQTRNLVYDSRGLLDTVDDYKNTLSGKHRGVVSLGVDMLQCLITHIPYRESKGSSGSQGKRNER